MHKLTMAHEIIHSATTYSLHDFLLLSIIVSYVFINPPFKKKLPFPSIFPYVEKHVIYNAHL